MTTAYDEIEYPGRAQTATHPDRLATVARLFGMQPAPVDRCRVLEIACGDGGNLIPLAYALPDSQFLGFDLAARPIEKGRQLAALLRLPNLTLRQLDLTEFTADAGEFDYIVAHGLYSWVPGEVRDALLGLIRRHLAPQGVGFVSYNVYPGCYVRRMLWEMLHFHTDHLTDHGQRLSEAQALTHLLARGRTAQDDLSALLEKDLERAAAREGGHFFHDDLAQINEPVYFHQFAAHAEAHGLQFLGEAELDSLGYAGISGQAMQVLRTMDTLTREQYFDFIRVRRFRQTMLCHADVALERTLGGSQLDSFLLGVRRDTRVRTRALEPGTVDAETASADQAARTRDEGLVQATLDRLLELSPRRITFAELCAEMRSSAAEWLDQCGEARYRTLVFGAALAGAIELHVHAPRLLAAEPGVRPVASALVRGQLEAGTLVTNLCHESVRVDDEVVGRLLALLDGRHDRADLVEALGAQLGDGDQAARRLRLEGHLRHLARLALLEA